MFEVLAQNRIGFNEKGSRIALRTMQDGAPDITPWEQNVDPASDSLFYFHPKSNSSSWTLPQGGLLDTKKSFLNKHSYIRGKFANIIRENCLKVILLSIYFFMYNSDV